MDLSYLPGDIIVPPCDAFFKCLYLKYQSDRCHTCFRKSDTLLPCNDCMITNYCSAECYQQDLQNGHSLACMSQCYAYCQTSWAREYHVPLFLLYAMLECNPDMKTMKYPMTDGTFRGIFDLYSNQNLWACDIKVQNMCADLVRHLRNEDRSITTSYFLLLFGILMSNSIKIRTGEESVGEGIYMECTPFDHSCSPNAHCEIVNGKLQVQALVFIQKDEFPLISYLDLNGDVDIPDYQEFLMYRYKFRCFCRMCRMEYDVFGDGINRMQSLSCSMAYFKSISDPSTLDFKTIENLHQEHIVILKQLRDQCGMEIAKHSTDFADLAMNMGVQREIVLPLYKTAAENIIDYCKSEDNLLVNFLKDRPYLDGELYVDDFFSEKNHFN